MHLKNRIEQHFSEAGVPITLKYIDPSYMLRGVPANAMDAVFCDELARYAAHAAMAGKTDVMVGRWHRSFTHVPLPLALSREEAHRPRQGALAGGHGDDRAAAPRGLRRRAIMEHAWPRRPSRDIMNAKLLYIGQGDRLSLARRHILQFGVTAVPVLDETHRPVGVVSLRDLQRGDDELQLRAPWPP